MTGSRRTSSDDGVGNVPSLAPDELVGTNYLIFIDELSAIRRDRDRVLDGLLTPTSPSSGRRTAWPWSCSTATTSPA